MKDNKRLRYIKTKQAVYDLMAEISYSLHKSCMCMDFHVEENGTIKWIDDFEDIDGKECEHLNWNEKHGIAIHRKLKMKVYSYNSFSIHKAPYKDYTFTEMDILLTEGIKNINEERMKFNIS